MNLNVKIDKELLGRTRLGLMALEGLSVKAANPALAAEIDAYSRELRERHAGATSGDVPETAHARGLYKSLGLDPTKTRPSNEALLRRVLKGEPLYAVNTLVDALNLCSLRYQLPFGLYDNAHIVPPIVLRKGAPGESYDGIRKGPVNVSGRPVLVDAQGPFGNPTSDSARTMITLGTRSALVTLYAPASFTTKRVGDVLDGTEAALTRACGGEPLGRLIL